MSSRSGAVYCGPVRPVRGSVLNADVRAHCRAATARMVSMTSSSMRPGTSVGRSAPGALPVVSRISRFSAIRAASGRGTASPARRVLAKAVRIARASSGCGLHFSGGSRIWLRGSVSGRSVRHSIAAMASWRRATGESESTGTANASSRYAGTAGSVPTAANAAPTAGSNGASTTAPERRRTVRSAVTGSVPPVAAAAIATVGAIDSSRLAAAAVSAPSPRMVPPRTEATPRILSTMSAPATVAAALSAGSLTRLSAPRSACA